MNKDLDQVLFLYILLTQTRSNSNKIEEEKILKQIAKLAIKNYL